MDHEQTLAAELMQSVPPEAMDEWAQAQLGALDLGDLRRTDRLVSLLASIARRPGKSLPEQCEHAAPIKAAYRLLDCPALKANEVVQCAAQSSIEELHQRRIDSVVLAVQDTTTFNFSTHEALTGRGPIGKTSSRTPQGFHAHSTLLVGEEGLVHGLLECETYARDATTQSQRKPGERNRQSTAQKESHRWLRSLEQSAQLCALLPSAPAIVNIADREADMYELLIEAQRLNAKHDGRIHILVRAQHDRALAKPQTAATGPSQAEAEQAPTRLWAHLKEQPAQANWQIRLPARKGLHGEQQRQVEALWQEVEIAVPAHQQKYQGHKESVKVRVIIVREPTPPKGQEALEWVLLTTWPMSEADDLRRVVGWYAKRWQIEVMHRIWKSGCGVEARRLQEGRAAQVMVVLDLLVAVKIMGLVSAARQRPEATTAGWLSAAEEAVLRAQFESEKTGTKGKALSLAQAVRWVSQLGGHRGAPSSPAPGADSLWRGITRLQDLSLGWKLATQLNKCG